MNRKNRTAIPLQPNELPKRVPKNHVRTPWGDLFVPPPEVLEAVDPSWEPGQKYIYRLTLLEALRYNRPYYTSDVLTDCDVPLTVVVNHEGSPDHGKRFYGVLRYVKGGASLGTIKRNERERAAKRKEK